MEILNVLAAGIAAFAFGAVWYSMFSSAWMRASGVPVGDDGKPANSSNPMTYITGLICAIIVAGMMRHVFNLAGIDTFGKGLVSGLGIGLFMAVPWLVTNYTFADRPRALMVIDGGYATFGSALIGAVFDTVLKKKRVPGARKPEPLLTPRALLHHTCLKSGSGPSWPNKCLIGDQTDSGKHQVPKIRL